MPDPPGLARVAGPLPPQYQAGPAGAAVESGDTASHGPQVVGPVMVYFERLEFSIARAEPAEAEPRFRIAVECDLVPQPVRYSKPESVAQRAGEDSSFRDRLVGTAADYFVGQYGNPAVAWASRQVWVSSQSFPETDLAGICGRISDELETITGWPLTEAGKVLGIPAPLDAAAAAIGADLVLEPVTRPLMDAARLCEIVGVGIGVLTGCHPLAVASAKLLARSEIHEQMARGIVEAGKLVFHGELPARAEPGDLSTAEEPSWEVKSSRARQLSREDCSRDRRPGVFDPGWPPTGWDGGRVFEEFREPGSMRELHSMANGRPGAHEQGEEAGPVRELDPFLRWVPDRNQDALGPDAHLDRINEDRGREGPA
jgi:hypothetical protein